MKDHRKIISAYDRFVPYRLLQLLGKKDITEIRLGDQVEKRITVLFTDIRDFTTLSETMTPQENFNFINSYFSQMEPIISVHNGIVDKYIGDAIMAIFPESADNACDCALSMLKQLRVYNEGRTRAGYPPIRIGIGLNTGLAMIGAVGGYNRMDGTVISDAVNLCARIESLTKTYGAELLVGESTYDDLHDSKREAARFIDRVLVKGKLKPQSIYEVFAADPLPERKEKQHYRMLFEEALAHYHYGHIDEAAELLERCLTRNPADLPAQVYLERCKQYQSTGYHAVDSELQNRISWSEVFLLGHEKIDEQHHQLVDGALAIIEKIEQDQDPAATRKSVTDIATLAQEHFHTEEGVMKASDYPLYQIHKRQHAAFLRAFPRLVELVGNTETPKVFRMFKVQIFLLDWLVNHTLKEDKHFGKFLAYSKE